MKESMKFDGNPVVTSLPDYVKQNADQLLVRAVLGAKTLDHINIQTGVKTKEKINLLSTDVHFKEDGSTCGFTPAGSQTITQREISTGMIVVNMEWCAKNLLAKYAQSKLNIMAGRENLPYEEQFINDILRDTDEKLDRLIWFGDTESLDANLKQTDGYIKILKEDSSVIDRAIAHGTALFDAVRTVLLAIPQRAKHGDAVIFCCPSDLEAYNQELVDKNLVHYEPGEAVKELLIPGSEVKLVAVPGLEPQGEEKHYLVGGSASNFYYGTDLENGNEVYDFWFSRDDRKFKYDNEFNAGVQVAFPDEVVLGEIANA